MLYFKYYIREKKEKNSHKKAIWQKRKWGGKKMKIAGNKKKSKNLDTVERERERAAL